MIEFRLDARSGVPTYLQLVQQVKQALRLGILHPGDQLPTVKEVVAKNLRLKNVEAAEDFYLEAQEELDRKPYPTLDGFKIVIKYVAEQNPKAAAIKAEIPKWAKIIKESGIKPD